MDGAVEDNGIAGRGAREVGAARNDPAPLSALFTTVRVLGVTRSSKELLQREQQRLPAAVSALVACRTGSMMISSNLHQEAGAECCQTCKFLKIEGRKGWKASDIEVVPAALVNPLNRGVG